MSNLRRYFERGCLSFTTHVTYRRMPILLHAADLLLECLNSKIDAAEAELCAWVIMPDHFHVLLNAPHCHIPTLFQRIKLSFSARYRKQHGLYSGRLWQLRYWDHVIRDEADFSRHMDYIHFNPVKHGMVTDALSWKHSSIHGFAQGHDVERTWSPLSSDDCEQEFGE